VLLGALACLCILFSALTYQHIARPLERFEGVVKRVRETKDSPCESIIGAMTRSENW